MDPFAHWCPRERDFGNPCYEEQAARYDAAFFDLSDRTQLDLRGNDRATFLQGFCTNDVRRLEPGTGCEAFVTDLRGRTLGHVFVFAREDSLAVDSVPGVEEALTKHWGKYVLAADVELVSRTQSAGTLFATGGTVAERLAGIGILPRPLGHLDHLVLEPGPIPAEIRRVDLFGRPGYFLKVPRELLPGLAARLRNGGFVPGGADAFHALRIEAGFPWFGIDFDADNLAQEIGRTARAISFTKGCYLGQEPIARIDAMGHVNRELRTLKLGLGPQPAPGATVHPVDDAAEIGRVTSVGRLPTTREGLGIALLRTAHLAPGHAVRVAVGDGFAVGTVAET